MIKGWDRGPLQQYFFVTASRLEVMMRYGMLKLTPKSAFEVKDTGIDIAISDRVRDSSKSKRFTHQSEIRIKPHELIFIDAMPWIRMPQNITAIVVMRSTAARMGIDAHLNEPQELGMPLTMVKPGWSGRLVLEVRNDSESELMLKPGAMIASLVFVDISNQIMYSGAYNGQDNVKKAVETNLYPLLRDFDRREGSVQKEVK